MKRLNLILLSMLAVSLTFGQSIQEEVNKHLQNLPFKSFAITVPTFKDKVYNIKDAGAVGDGVFKCTNAINSTIKKCSAEGGGMVLIPAGLWLTGPITMQSNVNLHLEAGAQVVFSAELEDNPLIDTGGGKYAQASLINGSDIQNVAITGKGTFNGNGDEWRPVKKEKMNEKAWNNLIKTGEVSEDGKMWYPRKGTIEAIKLKESMEAAKMTKEDYEKTRLTLRSYTLNVEKVKNLLIEGVTLTNSPHITAMIRSIDGLVLKNVSVVNNWWNQNADGLDISRCKNVLLYDCTVNTGDDGICMKSSGGKPGEFLLENIVINDCKVFHGHGAFVIGSNTDGGMRNISVKNLTCSWTETGLRFKTGKGRGGRVENIFIDGVAMKDIEKDAIGFDLTYEDKGAIVSKDFKESESKLPDFDGISIKNVYCDGAKTAISIGKSSEAIVRNVKFENIVINAKQGMIGFAFDGITFDNVQLNCKGVPYQIKDSKNVSFKNIKQPASGVFIKVQGAETKNISIENSTIKKENVEILDSLPATVVTIK